MTPIGGFTETSSSLLPAPGKNEKAPMSDRRGEQITVNVIEWLLDSDPSIRWQVMRDLIDEFDEVVASERSRVTSGGLGWPGSSTFGDRWSLGWWPLHLTRILLAPQGRDRIDTYSASRGHCARRQPDEHDDRHA
jgi:hypothetical protein